MRNGKHQLFARDKQVFSVKLGFFQFFPVMVPPGDVFSDYDREYEYHCDGYVCHGACRFLPDFPFLCQARFVGSLLVSFNVFQQLVYPLAQVVSGHSQAFEARVQHACLLLFCLEHFMLDSCQHVRDCVYRAVYFVERIGVFFLYDVVDQCRIFFGSKHVGQSFEKTLLLVPDCI